MPLPDDEGKLTQALMKAVLLRKRERDRQARSRRFDFGEPAARAIETAWQSAGEKAAKNRTVFAQRRLKPEDVLPEWHKTSAVLGGEDDVAALRAPRRWPRSARRWKPHRRRHFKLHARPACPTTCASAWRPRGLTGTLRIDFHQPPAPGARFIHRSHPLVGCLADTCSSARWTTTPIADDDCALPAPAPSSPSA